MDENKRKHLEFLQLTITRMGLNSFLIKGWSITLVAAMFAFSAKDSNNKYTIITIAATYVFWILDAYFLSQERQFRGLYNEVRQKDEADINFEMDPSPYKTGKGSWSNCFFAITPLIFYSTILIISMTIYYYLGR